MEQKKYTKLYIKLDQQHLDYILELVDDTGFSPSFVINCLFKMLNKEHFTKAVKRAAAIVKICEEFDKAEAEREERLRCGNSKKQTS